MTSTCRHNYCFSKKRERLLYNVIFFIPLQIIIRRIEWKGARLSGAVKQFWKWKPTVLVQKYSLCKILRLYLLNNLGKPTYIWSVHLIICIIPLFAQIMCNLMKACTAFVAYILIISLFFYNIKDFLQAWLLHIPYMNMVYPLIPKPGKLFIYIGSYRKNNNNK